MTIGYVFGKSTSRYLNIIGQEKAFIQNEYLIIKDNVQGEIPCEVIETSIYPMMVQSIMPDGCAIEFITGLGLETNKVTFLAKVKVLKDLSYPIMPLSVARKSKYDEIKHIITNAKPNDSMVLGVIKGTEDAQSELPEELKNIAPLWVNGKAVDQVGIPFLFNHHKLREYPHIGLFGSSGSGKSCALRTICEELMKIVVPGLAFDPHYEITFQGQMEGLKPQFIKDYSDRHEIFYIGKNVGIKFTDLSSMELIKLFDYVNALTEPQSNVIEVLYEKGDTFVNLQNKINILKEAFIFYEKPERERKNEILTAEQTKLYAKCKNKISGASTLQALSWKCIALENTGIFSCGVDKVDVAIRQGKLAILRGNITKLKMLSSYVINKLYKKRRHYADWKEDYGTERPDYYPPFVIVLDEAHNFAPGDEKNYSPTRAILRTIVQESRKYGVFLIPCTQRPHALDETLVSQLNTKFMFRLTNIKDMQIAKVEGNLTDEEVSRLPDLPSGHCFVTSAILNKTYPVKFRTTFSKAPNASDPFEELKDYVKSINENSLTVILEGLLPIKTDKLANIHPTINSYMGRIISIDEITEGLESLVRCGKVDKVKTVFGCEYKKI